MVYDMLLILREKIVNLDKKRKFADKKPRSRLTSGLIFLNLLGRHTVDVTWEHCGFTNVLKA